MTTINKKKFNRTKIIATIGPSSHKKSVLKKMVLAGVNVFRFNFSHGSYEEYKQIIRYITELNEELVTNIGILADLQGPKIRIGEIEDGTELQEGEKITITTKPVKGEEEKIYINYGNFPKDVDKGEIILIDDGKIELEVVETNRTDTVKAQVIYGGPLSSNKGVNLPNTTISLPSMTDKDIKDLHFALKNQFNWIALSFVRTEEDIKNLRKIIDEREGRARIIAKIEKPEAVNHIDGIIEATDAIMIARGDLGVELPAEELPLVQKEAVAKSIRAAKPVIIATQIMESMIENPRPTRAEVTDVANAVTEGADCLMLSGETSVGKYPVKVIQTIERIIAKIEQQADIYLASDGSNKWHHIPSEKSPTFLSDAVCFNACKISVDVGAEALIGMTQSGYTAFMVSSFRPRGKVYIFTNNRFLLNTLSLVWGARGFYYNKMESTDSTIYDVKNILLEEGYVKKGDRVINLASMPIHEKGRTNMLKVSKIE